MIYTTFAKLYDDLMDPEMYANWLDFAEDELVSGMFWTLHADRENLP